jgi:hypothetical protein
MELITLLDMLCHECERHNGDPHHVTDKLVIEHGRHWSAMLRAVLEQCKDDQRRKDARNG